MKRFLSETKSALTVACVIYTVLITLLYTIGKVFMNDDGGQAWIPHFGMMWMVLGVSVAFGIAERFLALGEATFIRILGHFGISLIGFTLIFVIGGGYAKRGSQLFIAMFMFLILYAVVMGVRFGVKSILTQRKNNSEEYSSMFEEKKKTTKK